MGMFDLAVGYIGIHCKGVIQANDRRPVNLTGSFVEIFTGTISKMTGGMHTVHTCENVFIKVAVHTTFIVKRFFLILSLSPSLSLFLSLAFIHVTRLF